MLSTEECALQEKVNLVLFLWGCQIDSVGYHRALLFYFKVSHALLVHKNLEWMLSNIISLLGMQILWPRSRPTESEIIGEGSSNLCFNQLSG